MIQELAVKTPLLANESCESYLIRLAMKNGYPTKNWLESIDRSLRSTKLRSNPEITSILHKLTGRPEEEFATHQKSFIRQRLSSDLLVNSARLCPKCIAENMCFDYMWQVAYASACPYHGVLLVDECPRCNMPLTWNISNISKCNCSADFRIYPVVQAESIVLYYNQLMWLVDGRAVSLDNILGASNKHLNALDLNGLCKTFRLLHRAALKIDSGKVKIMRVNDALEVFRTIYPLLEDWPKGFKTHLDSYKREDGTFNGEGLQQSFGSLYRNLYRDDSFCFLREEFQKYVQTDWVGALNRKYYRLSQVRISDYECLKSVASEFHITEARLRKLMDLDILKGLQKKRASGRIYTLIKKSDIQRFGQIFKNAVNRTETIKLLGVSKRQINVLLESGFIKALVKHGELKLLESWFDLNHLQTFLNQFMDIAIKVAPKTDMVSFYRVSQAHFGDVELLPKFLKAILSGEIRISGTTLNKYGMFSMASLNFCREDIIQFRRKHLEQRVEGITVPEASRRLGFSQGAIYDLIHRGIIKSQKAKLTFCHGSIITYADLSEFELTYAPLSILARDRNVHWKTLFKILSMNGLKPAIGGGTDTCIKVLYFRKEADKVVKAQGVKDELQKIYEKRRLK